MTAGETREIAETLLRYCRTNETGKGLDTLYSPDVVSVEACCMPESDSRETRGIEALRGKHAWWADAMEPIESGVERPFLHGDDRFGAIFHGRWREKASGKVFDLRELAIYTVADGRIVREEFFYTM